MTDKSGQKATYTADIVAHSVIDLPGGGTATTPHVVRLHLSEVEDLLGRRVNYLYQSPADGLVQPHQCGPAPSSPPSGERSELCEISYNGNIIRFYNDKQADTTTSAIGGDASVSSQRLKTIDVLAGGARVRAYAFAYAASAATNRSTLHQVTVYGRLASVDPQGNVTGDPLPAQTFTTDSATPLQPWHTQGWQLPLPANLPHQPANTESFATQVTFWDQGDMRLGDFTGDGRSGIVFRLLSPPTCQQPILTKLHPAWADISSTLVFPWDYCYTWQWWAGDVNNDGRTDLIFLQKSLRSNQAALVTFLGRGDGTFGPGPTSGPVLSGVSKPGDCEAGDVNGDRRLDVVCVYAPPDNPTHPRLVELLAPVAGNNVAVHDLDPNFSKDYGDGDNRFVGQRFTLGDVNGDGRADIIHILCDGSPACTNSGGEQAPVSGLQTLLASGTGAFSDPINSWIPTDTSLAAWRYPESETTSANLNGDGLTDFVAVSYQDLATGYYSDPWIVSAISQGEGNWKYTVQQAPGNPQITSAPIFLTFVPLTAGEPAGYMYAVPHLVVIGGMLKEDYLEVIRVPGNGDGTFAVHAEIQKMDVSVDPSLWGQVANFLIRPDLANYMAQKASAPEDQPPPRSSRGLPTPVKPTPQDVQRVFSEVFQTPGAGTTVPGDFTGDGRTDFVVLEKPPSPVQTDKLFIGYPSSGGESARWWQPANLFGDGRPGLVNVEQDYPRPFVTTVNRRTSPPPQPWCFHHPGDPRCAPYVATGELLNTPRDPNLPRNNAPVAATNQRNWWLLDTTGTGRSSLVYVDSFQTVLSTRQVLILTYLPSGNGWDPDPVVTWIPQALPYQPGRWMPANLDGRGTIGLMNVALTSQPNGVVPSVQTLASDTSGHWSQHITPLEVINFDSDWRAADINGDGATDLVHLTPSGDAPTVTTVINDRNGAWHVVQGRQRLVAPDVDADVAHWLLGDFNGDGSADIVHIDTGPPSWPPTVTTFLSLGDGHWQAQPEYAIPTSDYRTTLEFGGWNAVDTNGDGRTDLIHLAPAPESADSASTVTGAILATLPAAGQYRLGADQALTSPGAAGYGWLPGDADGNAMADLVQLNPTGPGLLAMSEALGPSPPDRITAVSNGIGGTAMISYQPATSWQAANPAVGCALPAGVNPINVATLTVSAGTGSPSTFNYSYQCPKWSPDMRRVLGWQTSQSERLSSAAVPSLRDITSNDLTAECGDQITSRVQTNAAGHVLTKTATTYENRGSGPSSNCRPHSITVAACEGTDLCPGNTITYRYDDFGNISNQTQVQNTSARPQPSREITTEYTYSLDPYLVNLPSSTTLVDMTGSFPGTALTRTTYCYDQHCGSLAPHPKGLLSERIDVDLSGKAGSRSTFYGYDEFGNLSTITDANHHTTTTGYDPQFHIYPQSTTNALEQHASQLWDLVLGVLASRTDINNLTTRYKSDQYGRLTDTKLPSGAASHIRYLNFGDPATQRVRTYTDDASPDGTWTETRFDGLGRTILLSRKGDSPERAEATRTTYADAGQRVFTQSHWTISSALTLSPIETYHYDALDRPVAQTHPDGSAIVTQYLSTPRGSLVVHVNETGHRVDLAYDAWGRETSVMQPVTGKRATLSYGYDAADHQTSITDDAGNTTIRTWNSLGEMTSEHDPDRGTTTFTYHPIGNLHTATDARKITTSYTYDAVNRLIKKEVTGIHRPTVWHYDQRGHGPSVGLLTSVSDPSGSSCPHGISENLTYDRYSRPSTVSTCIAGRAVRFTTRYDHFGRQKAITYPEGHAVAMRYGPSGRLSSLGRYATGATYDPSGNLATLTLGNGVRERWTIDPIRGWTTRFDAQRGRLAIYNSSISPDSDGSIEALTSSSGGDNRSFNYDNLTRLTSTAGDTKSSATFDTTGNITFRSSLGSYSYGQHYCLGSATPPQPHAVSRIGAAGSPRSERFCYDADGNRIRTKRAGIRQDITWARDGTPARIVTRRSSISGGREPYMVAKGDSLWSISKRFYGNGGSWRALYNANKHRIVCPNLIYVGQHLLIAKNPHSSGRDLSRNRITRDIRLTYGPEGQLARQTTGSLDIRYFGPQAQWQSGRGLVSYYYFGNLLIARSDNTGMQYYQADHLGSPRTATNSRGAVVARIRYDPWGTTTVTSGRRPTGSPAFSGAIPIAGTQYLQMGARLYDPTTGRFLTPDPISPASNDVQAANRYAYANNNPISNTDPSGYAGEPWDLNPDDSPPPYLPYPSDLSTPAWYEQPPEFNTTRPEVEGETIEVTADQPSTTPGPRLAQRIDSVCNGDPACTIAQSYDWAGLNRVLTAISIHQLTQPISLFTLGVGSSVTLAGLSTEYSAQQLATAAGASPLIVLGKVGEYVELGQQLNAGVLNIPGSAWETVAATRGLEALWRVNQAFLDAAIKMGAWVRLASPLEIGSSFYARELTYLVGQGYYIYSTTVIGPPIGPTP